MQIEQRPSGGFASAAGRLADNGSWMMADTRTSRGLEIYAELRGEDAAARMSSVLEGAESFSRPISELAVAFAFGSVWTREGLGRRERSLATIGALVALRQPDELRKHIEIGIGNGLTLTELRETLLQIVPYAGFPAVATAMEAAIAAIRGLGLDPDDLTGGAAPPSAGNRPSIVDGA